MPDPDVFARGRLRSTLDEEVRNGQSVVYTIRPESLATDDRTLETDNVWNGVVENATYKGSFTVYEVDIGGRLLKVQRQRRAGVGRTEEGQLRRRRGRTPPRVSALTGSQSTST